MHYNSDNILKNFIIMLYILQKILHSCCLIISNDDDFLIPECFFHDFRMVELLRLKRSLTYDDNTCLTPTMCMEESAQSLRPNSTAEYALSAKKFDFSKTAAIVDAPAAMALKADERGFPSSVDYHSWQHVDEPSKPSKLQTLFQITITSLAFLSFGGYLLCLIVQTIKSKGTTYFHPVATTATTTNTGVKRIKVYRRSRRNVNSLPLVYENASFAFYSNSDAANKLVDDMDSALPNSTDMYNTLLRFAESYVKTLE